MSRSLKFHAFFCAALQGINIAASNLRLFALTTQSPPNRHHCLTGGYAFIQRIQGISAGIMEGTTGDVLMKLGLALLIGTVIGAEREFKNKSAGLRTLILICVGSTLFTMVSGSFGADSERARIASNIVTGIGFLGAGAIMREGLTVSGLTTASTIWVTAALGMAVGAGEYLVSVLATIMVMTVLTLFGAIPAFLDRHKKVIDLYVTLSPDEDSLPEKEMERFNLKFERIRTIKKDGFTVFQYELSGPKGQLESFLKTLSRNPSIRSFEY